MEKYTLRYRWLDIRHTLKEYRLALTRLKWRHEPAPVKGADAVVCVDGRQYHGGLCDRFKGIITLYAYCKQRGLGFRIRHEHPFPLEDYLIPASYDWLLKPGEWTTNIRYCRFFHMRGENLAVRLRKLHTAKQIRYSGNRNCLHILNQDKGTNYKWGELFRELFQPAPDMAARLERLKAEIGAPYHASVFRFQNLLGDFKEYHYKALESEEAREELISKCLSALKKRMEECGGKPMLVTSDSVTFLEAAARIPGVYTIPGTVAHMGGGGKVAENSYEVYMKSFLDFYMLSDAESIACIGTPQMYPSAFPAYAALVYEKPFVRIQA
ncbi:MAG: hypothetical protein K2M92_00565 [Bacteroidales bacterium]|nr:hypothetical protein [Bacteroidales bacterium]